VSEIMIAGLLLVGLQLRMRVRRRKHDEIRAGGCGLVRARREALARRRRRR
jgi:hypothetical protein